MNWPNERDGQETWRFCEELLSSSLCVGRASSVLLPTWGHFYMV